MNFFTMFHWFALASLFSATNGQASTKNAQKVFPTMDWKKFHSWPKMEKYWKSVGDVADNVTVEVKAKTQEDRSLYLVTVDGEKDSDKERVQVIINCAQHAREYSAAQTCPYLVWYWLENPEKIKGMKIFMFPMMNPDGYAYAHDEGNRMWRKNRDKVPNNSVEKGLDENRNWPTNYVASDLNGDGENSRQQTWAGTAPLQSIEDKTLKEFCDKFIDGKKSKLKFHLDVHGSTKDYWIIGYPPNVQNTVPKAIKHKELLHDIAAAMTSALPQLKDSTMKPQAGETPGILYDATGTIGDTMVEEENIICSFLMEIPGDEQFDPREDIDKIVRDASQAIDKAFEQVKKGRCDVQRRRLDQEDIPNI